MTEIERTRFQKLPADRNRYEELIAILYDEELLRLKRRSQLRNNSWLERILETELNKRGVH